ncbi:hypothetical protein ES815_22215 [Leclercia adecarboxylata]|uniref:Eaa protein n=1 Tax=Leclercia adecarboxylata TaxID=83655 RepID=A0AAP9IS13_9ENTR|nr:hypothetical protein [Leclercia adecarboxylata]QDK20879.1 hypothetical protein ES815_22215 [Leclercia adecarboxylata]
MSKFTKEQLIEWAQTHKKRAEEYLAAVPSDEYGLKDLALFEIALAALTAPTEPVYQYRIRNCYNGQVTEWQTIRRDQVDFVLKAQPHNAEFQIITPPAPQLPHPAAPEKMTVEELPSDIKQLPAATALVWMEGWNACLTAMISGTKGDDHATD